MRNSGDRLVVIRRSGIADGAMRKSITTCGLWLWRRKWVTLALSVGIVSKPLSKWLIQTSREYVMAIEDLILAFGRLEACAWILGMNDEQFNNYVANMDKIRKNYQEKLAARSAQKSGVDTGEHRE